MREKSGKEEEEREKEKREKKWKGGRVERARGAD